eukprot:COSAG02_NODE_6243_length_3704_cov_12.964494_1_plen_640_part_00
MIIPPSDPCGETLVDRLPAMMMPPMQKMAAPLALASALCHVATIAVIGNMHIQSSTLRETPAGPHRALLDSDGDSLVTVAHMTKAVDHLQDTLGSRLTAMERENSELKASVKVLVGNQTDTDHDSYADSDDVALDEPQIARTQRFHNTTVEYDQLELRALEQRVDELQATVQSFAEGQRRGLQGAEPEPEPEIGENVKIIKPQVVRCGGPGGTTSDGAFDYAQCDDHAFAVCHADACAGHRRAQGKDGSGEVGCSDVESRSAEVTQACCDEPEEDCTGGYPHTCNAGCAGTFLRFWEECRDALGKDSSRFEPVVALCTASAGASRPSLAEQLNLQCTDGTAAADCVPECSERYHGYLMLLNIDGDDSKLSCELRHGLYSWMGAASEGGYLGADAQSFFSAVVSGAAGSYIVTLTADADINTELVIRPGQDVRISGRGESWGSGGFTVQVGGSLSLAGVALAGSLMALDGSSVTVSGGSLGFFTDNVIIGAGTTLTLNPQCYRPYTTVSDLWRDANAAAGNHGDGGNGIGGNAWYRFEGPGGDALALESPGVSHCGTGYPGWLSGWDSVGPPPRDYSTPGRYPTTLEGVAEMIVCFEVSRSNVCTSHVTIGAVRCGNFLLWQLPDSPGSGYGYCTAPSGL